jgi:hypothetical protein
MRSQSQDLHLVRPFSVEGGNQTVDKRKRVRAPGRGPKFLQRPQASALSDSITLFFIARNRVGFWIAREAKRRTGGIFLFKNSALRFAKENSGASGCATMFLAERLELDVENRGNQLIGWISMVRRRALWPKRARNGLSQRPSSSRQSNVLSAMVGPSKSRPPMSHRKTDLGNPVRPRICQSSDSLLVLQNFRQNYNFGKGRIYEDTPRCFWRHLGPGPRI